MMLPPLLDGVPSVPVEAVVVGGKRRTREQYARRDDSSQKRYDFAFHGSNLPSSKAKLSERPKTLEFLPFLLLMTRSLPGKTLGRDGGYDGLLASHIAQVII
jgi:hypothetical protein